MASVSPQSLADEEYLAHSLYGSSQYIQKLGWFCIHLAGVTLWLVTLM